MTEVIDKPVTVPPLPFIKGGNAFLAYHVNTPEFKLRETTIANISESFGQTSVRVSGYAHPFVRILSQNDRDGTVAQSFISTRGSEVVYLVERTSRAINDFVKQEARAVLTDMLRSTEKPNTYGFGEVPAVFWLEKIEKLRSMILFQTGETDTKPKPDIWFNGCDRSVPAALRYLSRHDRPIGGEQHFNSMHLEQLADEIELVVKRSRGEV